MSRIPSHVQGGALLHGGAGGRTCGGLRTRVSTTAKAMITVPLEPPACSPSGEVVVRAPAPALADPRLFVEIRTLELEVTAGCSVVTLLAFLFCTAVTSAAVVGLLVVVVAVVLVLVVVRFFLFLVVVLSST